MTSLDVVAVLVSLRAVDATGKPTLGTAFMSNPLSPLAFSGRLRAERPHPDRPRRPGEPLRRHARLRHQARGAAVPEGHADRRAGERRRRRVGPSPQLYLPEIFSPFAPVAFMVDNISFFF